VKRRRGLSLVEVLLALMLMSVVLVASVILLQWALRGSLVQRQRSEAANLAERKTEELWAGSSIAESASGSSGQLRWTSKGVFSNGMTQLDVTVSSAEGEQRFVLHSERRSIKHSIVYSTPEGLFFQNEDSQKQRLISSEVKGDFSVSRDGAWLAYSDPSRKLHLIDLHSGKERPLTVPEGAFEPNFSPDCQKLAFTLYDKARSQVYLLDIQTGRCWNQSQSLHEDGNPTWSGQNLAWCREGSKVVVQHGTSEQILLDDSNWNWDAQLSADGQRLTFISNRDGVPQVYAKDLKEGTIERLTTDNTYKSKAVLSQDGRQILYLTNSVPYTMSQTGSGQQKLIEKGVVRAAWAGSP
jgi:prepilin-type N-terminal cleavage/methylation domain-containing protein